MCVCACVCIKEGTRASDNIYIYGNVGHNNFSAVFHFWLTRYTLYFIGTLFYTNEPQNILRFKLLIWFKINPVYNCIVTRVNRSYIL